MTRREAARYGGGRHGEKGHDPNVSRRPGVWRHLLVATLGWFVGVQAQGYAVVVVRPGDSVGSIAQRYGISSAALVEVNRLDGHLIRPGDVLRGEAKRGARRECDGQ